MLADIPPDRTALDVRALFGDDYDRIRERRDRLIRFKKNQTLVDRLIKEFDEREAVRGEPSIAGPTFAEKANRSRMPRGCA